MRGVEYTIKAIPTVYAGVQMRSRLEARWAAFFTACGWSWTYEPFDLNGWAPDFQLNFSRPVLVEVKPHTDHMLGRVFRDIVRPVVAVPDSPRVMMVGATPSTQEIYADNPFAVVGWGTDHEAYAEGQPELAVVRLDVCGVSGSSGHLGLFRDTPNATCAVCRQVGTPRRDAGHIHANKLWQDRWALACNATQWHPSQK